LNPDPRSDPSSDQRAEAVEDSTGRRKDDPYQFRYRGRIGNIATMKPGSGTHGNINTMTAVADTSEHRQHDRYRGRIGTSPR
jgi:hypothetical protein